MVYRLQKAVPTGSRNMASVTVVGTLGMTTGFTAGDITVMTGDTLIGGFIVRKRGGHRCPCSGGMTSIAQIAG